jgi:hypothetical protein
MSSDSSSHTREFVLILVEQRLRWSSALRPLLGAMQHTKDFHVLSSHPVGEYLGCSRDDKLAGIRYATGTAGRRIITEDFYSVG